MVVRQGWYVWLQIGSDWPQMGQIRGFFRSDFSALGAGAPNALESDLKKPRICPIWGQSHPLWSQTYHLCIKLTSLGSHCPDPPPWGENMTAVLELAEIGSYMSQMGPVPTGNCGRDFGNVRKIAIFGNFLAFWQFGNF